MGLPGTLSSGILPGLGHIPPPPSCTGAPPLTWPLWQERVQWDCQTQLLLGKEGAEGAGLWAACWAPELPTHMEGLSVYVLISSCDPQHPGRILITGIGSSPSDWGAPRGRALGPHHQPGDFVKGSLDQGTGLGFDGSAWHLHGASPHSLLRSQNSPLMGKSPGKLKNWKAWEIARSPVICKQLR